TPCLEDFDGEVEDYTITVEAAGADTEAPVITLNGGSVVNVNQGGTYNELGATATDNVDGDLTSSIVIGGDTVDANTLGTYVVTYNVSDAAGNAAVEVTRTVNVIVATYCDSFGNTDFNTSVTRVVFGTIDNVDAEVPKDNGYEDFTNISTDVVQGTTVDLTVQVNTDGNFLVQAFAWIDWNQDSDFDDAGEEYDLGQIANVADGALPTLPILIPESFNFGPTRLRVSAQYLNDPTSCLTDFDGEVEDYTVDVKYDGLLYSGGTWEPNAPNGTTSADNVLVLNGTYNAATDISMNDILVNTGATINIPKEYNITVVGDITNNGEFVLNSDSNEFSSLLVDGTVTGNLKYNRHVTSNAGGNDLIAPPVSGEVFTSFIANNSNVFANGDQSIYLFGPFEKPVNDYALYTSTETATLDAGIGYRTASTDDGTFTFEGAVTNGTLNIPIVKTGTDFEKWNMVGNPYTSYIRLDTFLTENLTQLESQTVAIYGYDADDSNGSVWTIWNFSYSDSNPNSLIAPGQAFFVSSPDGGSQVTFTPAMRSTGASDDFIAGRNGNFEHFIFRMAKTDGTRAYDTDIYIKDNMTMGLDIGYDAGIFQGDEPEPYMIYTQLSENGEPQDMAIQSIGFDDVNGTNIIPVGVNLLQGIQVEISMDASTLNYNIYLEDTELGIVTLLNNSNYTFTSDTDMVGTGRFFLRFEQETLSNTDLDLENILVFSDSKNDQIVVQGQLTDDTEFVLYDIQGRVILRKDLDLNSTINTIDTTNFSNGVYLVQLTSKTNSLSKKLIIR
ncbi:MAG: DUF5011 domain-containing protein, partial [Psychroserpens sp.]|nr:DUF5011 domain-containing protein [Psychroserpens sp.]